MLEVQDWHLFPWSVFFLTTYRVSEAAIEIRTPTPCPCCVNIDSVDITSIRDVEIDVGCCLASVTVFTMDPTVRGGRFRMLLDIPTAKRVHATVRNLWEEDQLRMGRKAEREEP